ncbi:MAG: YihY/virulence factor BrkB family protein [Chloroflexi bacterium]|nr:YihY/virulence factor BrkB family protein [Chloroflexota bacterium]
MHFKKAIAMFRHALVKKIKFLEDLVGHILVVRLIGRTFHEMSADDATHMAAGVAYYVLFSLFPLILGLIAVLSFFVDDATAQTQLTDWISDFLPGSEELVVSNIDAVVAFRGALGIFALVGLFWSGSAVFGAITRAVNRAWDVVENRPFYVTKMRQLTMAVATGMLFAVSLTMATVVRTAGNITTAEVPGIQSFVNTGSLVLLQGGSFALMLTIFLLLYKYLPNTKTYWRYVWPGALVGALLFELAKNAFIFYLNSFTSFENVYGSLAPVVAMLLWAYISSLILILGAELSSEYGRLKSGVERGVLIHQ